MATKTIQADEALLQVAREYFDSPADDSALINQALTTYIHVQAGRRLAELGGTDPEAKYFPGRHWG